MKWIVTGLLFVLMQIQAAGQQRKDEELIKASQGAASSLFFKPAAGAVIGGLESFNDGRECVIRKGMPHIMDLLKNGKPARIAFIGGSITQTDYNYRQQTARFLADRYPNARIEFLNAGVSGTGADLGACRLNQHVLIHKPDLIFIEFAVNGAFAPGLEGMVRQVISDNPLTDICLIYTIKSGQSYEYATGMMPENIKRLEGVAEQYGLTSIHLGLQASLMEKENKLLWKGTPEEAGNRVLFSSDGIHPTREGGNLYAQAIARTFLKLEKQTLPVVKKELPPSLLVDPWEDAKMFSPQELAQFNGNWEKIEPPRSSPFYRYKPWFPYIMKSSEPGASFTFRFEGSAFGIFDIGGPEVGQIDIVVDGKSLQRNNRFNKFCNNRYRGQYELINVPEGKHTVTIILSREKADKRSILGSNSDDIMAHPEKYDQTVLYLGRILLRGNPL